MNMSQNSLHRFSDRVEHYVRHRPQYPAEVFDFLTREKIIAANSTVADIGSGTGLSAEPLLKNGCTVYGIEPNDGMRASAEKLLAAYPLFKSMKGSAENTTLPDHSVDAILAGQAFHWFDKIKSKREFSRVLKAGGYTVLMWNDRRAQATDFLKVYEDFMLMFGTDYKEVNHKHTQDAKVFNAFFGEGNYKEQSFYNFQDVDFSGLKGRVLSTSYMPNEGHPDFDHMIYCLKKIFTRYQQNGTVKIEYDTRIYYGQLK
jgi:SAM-dependent methyltransferase